MPYSLPNAQKLEQSLLGSLMVYPSVWQNCRDQDLTSEELFLPSHQKIYEAMFELAATGKPIDIRSVYQRLTDKDQLQEAGGLDYLSELEDSAVSSITAPAYIDTIKAKAQLRSLIAASEDIGNAAATETDELDDILDSAERKILDVTRQRRGSDFESSQVVVNRVLQEVASLKDHKGVNGIRSGYTALDNMTNGLHPGELIILAARPAMGKSAFALNLANQVARYNKEGAVAVFSLEMDSDSLIKRLISSESKVLSDKIRSGRLDTSEMNRLSDAGNRLSERNIYIDDTSAIRVGQIFSKCRKLKSQHGSLSLVVIDYLQLISGNGRSDSRQQEVSEISRNLKILAKEMECPVLALSQLSRKVEERQDHQPQLSDLRESGSIEQDADIVMFLYRAGYYAKKKDDDDANQSDTELVDLNLAKHRNGAIGSIKLVFEKNIGRFSSYTTAGPQ